VRLLTNPLFLRMAVVFFAAAFAFVLGLLLVKRIRRAVQEDSFLGEGNPETDSFPLHTYHAVIQQLKQQKHELQSLQQQERRRAKTTENVSAAVLSNLSSGVLFFNTSGLIRQANQAAKNILGFAGPIGMNSTDLFRDARVRATSPGQGPLTLAEAISSTLRKAGAFRRMEADYVTPAGEERVLEVTVSPLYAANAELLGAACLINDQTEIAQIRRKQELRGEISAEMALALRNSLATISEYARKLAASSDPYQAEQMAADIAHEAQQLEHSMSAYLSESKAAGAAAGAN
jgi:PAS domain S-box-containing protein